MDMDQDGDVDLLATSNCKLFWYRNTSGTFEPEQQIIYEDSICTINQTVFGDIDNDGDVDITIVKKQAPSYDFFIYTLDNLGGGNFGPLVTASSSFDGSNGPFIQLGDIDNDGNADILEAHYTGYPQNVRKLSWASGTGSGSFLPFQVINSNFSNQFELHDFDLDGDLDVFYTRGYLFMIQENLGSAIFAPIDTIAPLNVVKLDFVHLNSDAYPDLTVSGSLLGQSGTSLYSLINVSGTFASPTSIPAIYGGYHLIKHSDMDDDGDQDIIVNFSGGTYEFGTSALGWYKNNGSGVLDNFQMIDAYAMGVYDMIVADFTGDGKNDLSVTMGLSSYTNDNVIAMYPYTPSGVQAPYTPIAIQADNVRSVIQSDVDSDGLTDIVVTSYSDKTVSWHKNLGNNTWGPMDIISEHATTQHNLGSYNSIAIDLDNDGDEDIITASYYDQTLVYYENLGGGSFSSEIILSTGYQSVLQLMKADVNNDGFQDLVVVTNTPNSEIVWLENNGSGALTIEHFIALGGNRTILGDLDQDGNIDVIRMVNGSVTWHKNTGGGVFSAASTVANVTLSYTRGLAVSDLNADGEMDVIIVTSQAWSSLARVTVAYNDGGAISFTPEIIHSYTGAASTGMSVHDFDLDGDMDFLNPIGLGQANLYSNLGNGQFNILPISVSERGIPYSSFTMDVDGDGDFDVVNGNGSIGVSILENLAISPFKASGKIYFDLNQNGVFDGADIGTNQFDITSTFASALIDLDNFGDYSILYSDSAYGTYQSEPLLTSNWGISSASQSFQQVINGTYVNQTNNDFGVYPDVLENDVQVDLTGGFAGCTDYINLWVSTSNQGTTRPTGNFELTLDNGLIYGNSNFTPDSIVGQTVYWHIDSVFYFTDSVVSLQVATPGAASTGDTLVSTLVSYITDASGASPQILVDSISQIINCNVPLTDKSGLPSGEGPQGYIDPSTPSIEYLIRFQNSTPNTAEYLSIRDLLDTNLVWSSVEIVSSSHPVSLIFYPNTQTAIFEFENIQLPSVTSDYTGSKGYLKFKVDIKPNRPFPTVIKNRAASYYDGVFTSETSFTYHTIYNCDSVIATSNLQTENCFNEMITGNVIDEVSSTDFVWTIPNVYTELGTDFDWSADTSGTFNVNLSASNEYCAADTSFNLTIHPEYNPPADSVSICIGDSIQVFGQYTSSPGVYVDSLQSIYGCDSIVSKELFELPLPNVTIYSLISLTCVNYSPIVLSNVSPPNGTFSGQGAVSNTFDPSIAGVGVHTVFYHYTNGNGCSSYDSIQLVVDDCAESLELSDNSNLVSAYDTENDKITLSITESTIARYKLGVYDVNGKLIHEDQMKSNNLKKIETQTFQKGIYVILIKDIGNSARYYFRKVYVY